jgi:geranylgeranyl transferase type-2 subunit beta
LDPYLIRLTTRLADGLARQPEAFRRRHAGYLFACQNDDGGFGGRDPASDLYYTAFALRGLAILGELTPETATKSASYVRLRLAGSATVIDFFSLLYACLLIQSAAGIDVLADASSDWPERVATLLESFRTPDGGYGKTPGAAFGSTYQTFLVALCYEMLGRSLPDSDAAGRFIRERRRDDGGFVEMKQMKRTGTNPTAAAVGLLQMTGALDDATKSSVADMLSHMQSAEGGLLANGRIPVADLLSTFTGCWTLDECGEPDRIDRAAALRYVRTLERPDGGFHGGSWDGGFDVEYTFYGLGAVALLEPPAGQTV